MEGPPGRERPALANIMVEPPEVLYCGPDGLLDLGLNPDIGLQADASPPAARIFLGYGLGSILDQVVTTTLPPRHPLEGATRVQAQLRLP